MELAFALICTSAVAQVSSSGHIYASASKPALTLTLTSNINRLEKVTGSYLSKSCQLIAQIDQKNYSIFIDCGSYGQKGNQPLLAAKTVVNASQLWL